MSDIFDCHQCGAHLNFVPGERALKCPRCGSVNDIPITNAKSASVALEELSYADYLIRQAGNEPTIERQTVSCSSCGAQTQLAENLVADNCPFCTAPLLARDAEVRRQIRPRSIGKFEVTEAAACEAFSRWIKSLWFAPNALHAVYRTERGLKGLYLPYWTYDADSITRYDGQRGEHYFETQTFSNQGRLQTRQVMRTAWTPVQGTVQLQFDDTLINASHTLSEQMSVGLAPWQLDRLEAYRDEFVSGFSVEAYQVALEPGFVEAGREMESAIANAIRADIGGDEQRIDQMSPQYTKVSFKHLLLPVWLSAYRYGDRQFRFVINGQTGAIQGERPYSKWKISGVVLLVLLIVLVGSMILQGK